MLNKNKPLDELIKVLQSFTVKEIIEFEERYDEQFKALKILYETIKSKNAFIPLTVLNALVSYQLSGTGEEYWWEFSTYFQKKTVRDPVNEMVSFLKLSSKNNRLTEVKIKRLKRARNLVDIIKKRERELCEKPEQLIKILQGTYKTKKVIKTFSFAVKMLHYACRIKFGIKNPMPNNIPIPQDIRVTKITQRLQKHSNITEFWNKISKKTGIPPLHIDSLLWITYGKVKRGEIIPNEKIKKLYKLLDCLIK